MVTTAHVVAVMAAIMEIVAVDPDLVRVRVPTGLFYLLMALDRLVARRLKGQVILTLRLQARVQDSPVSLENLSSTDAKALRHKYEPTFDGKFELVYPKLDGSMSRWWKKIDGKLLTIKLNNAKENAWQSVQYSVLDCFRPALSL